MSIFLYGLIHLSLADGLKAGDTDTGYPSRIVFWGERPTFEERMPPRSSTCPGLRLGL
jgi:hypothetical protein